MSRLQTLRLAELWRSRLQPLAGGSLRGATRTTLDESVYEGTGWLIEGVFCGYFDPRDAEVLWLRMRRMVQVAQVPEYPRFMPGIADRVHHLIEQSEPFATKDQMTEGAQRNFELPLFPHALLLADQLFADRLARICTSVLSDYEQEAWTKLMAELGVVDGSRVVERIANPAAAPMDMASTVAGFLRLLEHMEQSRQFFDFAQARAHGVDFESYLQRIGGLTAWHVPLADERARARFDQLTKSTWAILFVEAAPQYIEADWPEVERLFFEHVTGLRTAWEAHHLSAAFAEERG
jgi:hypothetical protein